MGSGESRLEEVSNPFRNICETNGITRDRISVLRKRTNGKISDHINFEYIIDEQKDGVLLRFSTESFDKASSFFGQDSYEVFLDRSRVMKLPHDLVHMGIHPIPETQPTKTPVTPDIYWSNGSEVSVVEICTTVSTSEESMVNIVFEKLAKYSGPISSGEWDQFNVICVTSRRVYDLNGEISIADGSHEIVSNYRKGIRVVNEFMKMSYSGGSNQEDRRCGELLSVLKLFNGEDVGMEDVNIHDDPMTSGSVRLSEKGYEKDFNTFEMWVNEYQSDDKRIDKSDSVFIHLPILGEYKPPREMNESKSKNVYSKIYNSSINIFNEILSEHSDFEDLCNNSFINQGSKARVGDNVYDTIRVKLDPEDQLELALRGVSGKKMSDHPSMIRKRFRSQMKYSLDTDTDDLDDVIGNDDIFSISDSRVNSYVEEIKHCELFSNPSFPNKTELFHQLMSVKYVKSIEYLDKIMREVTYNVRRKDHMNGNNWYGFIVRPIDDGTFVVIKNTSYEKGSNSFFSVYTTRDNLISNDIFERFLSIPNTDWKYCEFISVDRDRLSHYSSILSQVLSIWVLLAEELTDGIGPTTTIDKFQDVSKPLFIFSLILLEDSSKTSETLSLLRFYYMELFSGFGQSTYNSQKITNKFPSMIRSKLLVYLLKKLFYIHESIPDRFGMNKRRMVRTIDEENLEESDRIDKVSDGLRTPFQFSITDPKHIMMASYMSVMHNKDEDQDGHSSQQILEKTVKREYEFREVVKSSGLSSRDYCLRSGLDSNDFQLFQSSKDAIRIGSELVIDSICSENSFNKYGIKKDLERVAIKKLLKTTYEELCTMKASTIPFDSNIRIRKNSDDISNVGNRRKCLHAMILMSEEFGDRNVFLSINEIKRRIESEEQGDLQITMFKKNQIGGVREIYVLTMRGRIIMRAINDIFRSWCELHPSEKLTSELTKDSFTKEHFKLAKENKNRFKSTLKISSDMTNWANLFSMYEFQYMSDFISPQILKPLISYCLNLVRTKKIQLPRKAVEMWMESSITGDEYSTQRLRREFRGEEKKELINDTWSPVFNNETNMMQGILHYVSSFYHLIHLEFLKHVITRYADKYLSGVSVIMSFEVSSDDEGILITLSSDDKATLHSSMSKMMSKWSTLKNSVDKLFGVRTSFEKTTVSVSDLFEFNSRFYIGNTVVSPLIKFVARSCDDQPEESLHLRLSGLSNSLTDLRRNGGSGYLCHMVSICQALSFVRNLGVWTQSWYKRGLYQQVSKDKISHLGYYPILPPILSGLVGLEFSNWYSSRQSADSLKIVSVLSNYRLPSGDGIDDSLSYGMFPRQKWRLLLKRLELTPLSYDEDLGVNECRILLSGPKTIEESIYIAKMKARDPSISKSLAILSRSDTVMSSVYFLWSAMFPFGSSKLNLFNYRNEMLMEMKKRKISYTITQIFPRDYDYNSILSTSLSKFTPVFTVRERKSIPKWYSPTSSTPEHRERSREVISHFWFDTDINLSLGYTQMLFEKIKTEIPYLMDSMHETLSSRICPYSTRRQLINRILSYGELKKPIKYLSRGTQHKAINTIEGMIPFNTSLHVEYQPSATLILDDRVMNEVEAPYETRKELSIMEDRMSIWSDLFTYSNYSDRNKMMEFIDEDMRILRRNSSHLRNLKLSDKAYLEGAFNHFAYSTMSGSIESWKRSKHGVKIYRQVLNPIGSWRDDNCEFIHYKGGSEVLVKIKGSMIDTFNEQEKDNMEDTFRIRGSNHRIQSIERREWMFHDLSQYRGKMSARFYDPLSDEFWHILVPRSMPRNIFTRSKPLKGELSTVVNSWFQRNNRDGANIDNIIRNLSSKSDIEVIVTKSIIRQIYNIMQRRSLIDIIGHRYNNESSDSDESPAIENPIIEFSESSILDVFDSLDGLVDRNSDESLLLMGESLEDYGQIMDSLYISTIIEDESFNYSVDQGSNLIDDNPMIKEILMTIRVAERQPIFKRVMKPIFDLLDDMKSNFWLD